MKRIFQHCIVLSALAVVLSLCVVVTFLMSGNLLFSVLLIAVGFGGFALMLGFSQMLSPNHQSDSQDKTKGE